MGTNRVLALALLAVCLAGLAGCSDAGGLKGDNMRYQVHRLKGPMAIDADWNKPAWRKVQPVELTYFMGDRPEHLPKVQAKVLYDDQAVYVIFRVEDRYVRAVAAEHQGRICKDSCVEFFFVPGTDVAAGYFNLEMNCGGTMLFNFQVVPRENAVPVAPTDIEGITVAHSQPKIVEPEIAEPTTWTVEYRLPVEMLGKYLPIAVKPAPGVTWRANFYKCADATSHPHWLTWSHVDNPKPNFHLPQFLGTLAFE